jgi:hypothetical protein
MKKKNKFVIGLAFAVLTFGILYVTLGPRDHFSSCHKADTGQTMKAEETE